MNTHIYKFFRTWCRFIAPIGACACALTLNPSACAQDAPGNADLCYVLQPQLINTQDLADAAFDWLVLEPSRDATQAEDFTPEEIMCIRLGGPCTKRALAYLSIGEAEEYRDYWDPAWVDTAGNPIPGIAPEWLGPENPNWPGNYKVRYWHAEWQAIMLGTITGPNITPLDRIIDQRFDGVYLDIVDGYEYWADSKGGNELTRADAREKMIVFVETIANHARITRNEPDFMVFPQNASDIIRDDNGDLDALSTRYFAAVTGIGIEDLYYDELTAQPPASTAYRVEQLVEYLSRNKVVLVTDYVIDSNDPSSSANNTRVTDFVMRSRAEGFEPYVAMSDRELNSIVEFAAGGWSVSQPSPGCAP